MTETAPLDFEKPSQKSKQRLQKFLAECGYGSRRACEKLISSGFVSVNGLTVTELGVQVDPDSQQICVKGQVACIEPRFTAVINKPRQVLCTSRDPHGRKTVLDFLGTSPARVYTVGRLDYMSQGLVLLTNEGELAHRLTHPRFHVEKEYRVTLSRPLRDEEIAQFCRGVNEGGEFLRAQSISRHRRPLDTLWVLTEGKNRQIRRMASALNLDVKCLERIRMGSLVLGSLSPGQWRTLTQKEKAALEKSVGL